MCTCRAFCHCFPAPTAVIAKLCPKSETSACQAQDNQQFCRQGPEENLHTCQRKHHNWLLKWKLGCTERSFCSRSLATPPELPATGQCRSDMLAVACSQCADCDCAEQITLSACTLVHSETGHEQFGSETGRKVCSQFDSGQLGPSTERLNSSMEFQRTCFQRCRDLQEYTAVSKEITSSQDASRSGFLG